MSRQRKVLRCFLQDDDGFTPCFVAAWNPRKHDASSNCTTLLQLVERGVDVDAPDSKGVSPVNAALESGQFAAVRLLLAHGCQVNCRRWFSASHQVLRANRATLPFVQRFLLSMDNNLRRKPHLVEVAAILSQTDVVRMVTLCGWQRHCVDLRLLQDWVDGETQGRELLQSNVRMLTALCRAVSPLRDQCRVSLRAHLQRPLWRSISALPLPDSLKDFIKMSSFLEQFSES